MALSVLSIIPSTSISAAAIVFRVSVLPLYLATADSIPERAHNSISELGGEYKPIDPLRISLEYSKNKLTRKDTDRIAFNSNIATLRTTYQFTRFLFTRLRADYDSLSSNFAGQFLVGYTPSPGTAFYAGYNDNFNYNGFNPYDGQLEPRFARNNRTFFLRASYLFRKSL